MKQQSVKRASEVKLKDVKVEFVVRDGSINEVQFTDSEGNQCFISATTSYSATLSVYVPAAPKMVKKARLSGAMLGTAIEEFFEHPYQAEARKAALDEAIRDDSTVSLTVDEVEVPDDDEVPF